MSTKHCISQLFGGGNPWRIWQITGGSLNLTIQILTMSCDIHKESKKAGIHYSFTRQKFLMRNSVKFSSTKNSHVLFSMVNIACFI